MKILLVSNMFPSKKDGLFGVFVKNFKENLERQGAIFPHTVVIKGKIPNPLIKGFKYIFHYIKALAYGGFINNDFIYIHFLWHHTPIIIFLGGIFRKNVVVNIHGSDITKYNCNSLQRRINGAALGYAVKIVVPSLYFSEIIKKSFPNIEPNKIIIYPSGGINRKVFQLPTTKELVRGKTIFLGMTSRIDANKGWDVFLKAVSTLKKKGYSVIGFIIGQGNKEKQMLEMRKYLGIENDVQFLGLLSQKQMAEHYKNLDMFIFPTALNESLGLVGLEAMSCGLPIIASNIGAPSAYIDEGNNGYLFETNNVESLTEKIIEYISLSNIDKLSMRENAISTAFLYDSEKVSANLYKQLLELC